MFIRTSNDTNVDATVKIHLWLMDFLKLTKKFFKMLASVNYRYLIAFLPWLSMTLMMSFAHQYFVVSLGRSGLLHVCVHKDLSSMLLLLRGNMVSLKAIHLHETFVNAR